MWKNYVNFSDRTSVRGYWMAVLFNSLASIILAIITNITDLVLLGVIYSLATILPGLGITIRRLRDAGKEWYNIFWSLIPLVGAIILIVILCKPSIPDNGVNVV